MNSNNEPQTETLAETENFIAWKADEPDGETTYYLQMGRATINFFQEEWQQLSISCKPSTKLNPMKKACTPSSSIMSLSGSMAKTGTSSKGWQANSNNTFLPPGLKPGGSHL
jgi:hypothetical protein